MKSNFRIKTLVLAVASLMSVQSFASDEGVAAPANTVGERYPTQVINRPGIMPTGIVGVSLNSQVTNLKTVGVSLGSEFGLVKNLEGKFSYDGVEFNKWNAKNTFNLGAQYKFFGMSHMSNSLAFNLPVHVGNGEIVRSFSLGLPTTFYNDVMAGGILRDVFSLTMRPNIEVAFDFKVWYGYQVFGDFWAEINSSFGQFGMKNEKGQGQWGGQGFWKSLPLELGMTYALNNYFDVGGNVGFKDVFKPKESFVFGLNLAMRAGRLFG